MRGASAAQGVSRIRLVTVEKMLAIDHRFPAGFNRRFHAERDALEIFIERAGERDMHMIIPGLGDKDDRVGVRGEQSYDAWIVLGRSSGRLVMPKAAKRAPIAGLRSKNFVSTGLAPG